MNIEVMKKTTLGSLDGNMRFPEVVQALEEIGLESYHLDLVRMKKTFYMPNGEVHVEDFPFKANSAPAQEFSDEKVIAAVRSVQAQKLSYTEFLEGILKAGVTNYQVYIRGRRAVYMGRTGDLHIEYFPSARQVSDVIDLSREAHDLNKATLSNFVNNRNDLPPGYVPARGQIPELLYRRQSN